MPVYVYGCSCRLAPPHVILGWAFPPPPLGKISVYSPAWILGIGSGLETKPSTEYANAKSVGQLNSRVANAEPVTRGGTTCVMKC